MAPPDERSSKEKEGDLKAHATELLRRALTVGIGAAFLTEESLRNLVGEIKLPKELLGGILESAQKTKNEFLTKLSTDLLDRITSRLDVKSLVEEILERHEIELSVRLNFSPKTPSPQGEAKGKHSRHAPSRDDDPAHR